MTVGATTTWESTRDQLVKDALTNANALGPDDTPEGNQLSHGVRALDRLAKSIDPDGQFLWRHVSRSFTTTASTASYTLGADVLSVDEPARFLISGSAGYTPIRAMSRDDWNYLPDKTQEGEPSTLYYIDRVLPTTVTIHLWPVPSTSTATVEYSCFTRAADFVAGTDTPDFPAAWTDCLIFGLSRNLCQAYGQISRAKHYDALFEREHRRLLNADTEHGNIRFVPFGSQLY